MGPEGSDKRRHYRYSVRGDAPVNVHFRRSDDSSSSPVSCELLNLSEGGAMLNCPLPSLPADLLEVTIASADWSVSAIGTACWHQSHGESSTFGMTFEPLFPRDALETLMHEGILDRRLEDREAVAVTAEVWPPENYADNDELPWHAVVRDVSSTGFSILLPKITIELGSRIKLCLPPDTIEFEAEVRWQTRFRFGHLVGCKYTDKDDFSHFQRYRTGEKC